MELFLSEHGDVLKSVITGIMVVAISFICFSMLGAIIPEQDVSVEADNKNIKEIIKAGSPVIHGEELIYLDYGSEFVVTDYYQATDCDGTDITDKLRLKGRINMRKKGVYSVSLLVTGTRKYTTEKYVNIIVE